MTTCNLSTGITAGIIFLCIYLVVERLQLQIRALLSVGSKAGMKTGPLSTALKRQWDIIKYGILLRYLSFLFWGKILGLFVLFA